MEASSSEEESEDEAPAVKTPQGKTNGALQNGGKVCTHPRPACQIPAASQITGR